MSVDLDSNRLLVVFNGCSEDELEEIVEHEWPFELVGLAEHQKVQGLDCAFAEPARIFLLVSFFAFEKGVELVEGKTTCRQSISLAILVLLKLRVFLLHYRHYLRRILAQIAIGQASLPTFPHPTLCNLYFQCFVPLEEGFLGLFDQHRARDDRYIDLQLWYFAGKTDELDEVIFIDQTVSVLVENRESHPQAHFCPHADQLIDAVLGLPIGDKLRKRKREVQLPLFFISFISSLIDPFLAFQVLLKKAKNALPGKRAQKWILALLRQSFALKRGGFFSQLFVPFLINILQIATQQFVPSTDHVIDRLLIYGSVGIVLESLHVVAIFFGVLHESWIVSEEGKAPVQSMHGPYEPIDLVSCDIYDVIFCVVLRGGAGRTRSLLAYSADFIVSRRKIPLRCYSLPQGVLFLPDHGVALLPHSEQFFSGFAQFHIIYST